MDTEVAVVSVGGLQLQVRARNEIPSGEVDGIAADSTGLELWPASKRLAELCTERVELLRRAKCVLELGSGVGLPGMFVSRTHPVWLPRTHWRRRVVRTGKIVRNFT